MKPWIKIISFLCFFLISGLSLSSSSFAKAEKPPFDYIQGLTVKNGTVYVLDGTEIKTFRKNQTRSYYDLNKLMPLLSTKGLKNRDIIHTFKLTCIDNIHGDVYVMGLLFNDMQDKRVIEQGDGRRTHIGELILGESYTLFFRIHKGKASLLHLEKAYRHWAYERGTWFETEDGLPNDYFKWGTRVIYAYFKNVEWPRFSYSNGIFTFNQPRQNTENAVDFTDIYTIHNGKEKRIYSYKEPEAIYTLPVIEGKTLTIYKGYEVWRVNLETQEKKVIPMPGEYPLERPRYRNGILYCLTDDGIFTAKRSSKGLWTFKYVMKAEDAPINLYINGYDVEKYVYLGDFYRKKVQIFKP